MAGELKKASGSPAGEVVSFLQEVEVHGMRPRTPVVDHSKDSFASSYSKKAHLPADVGSAEEFVVQLK